MEDEAVFDRLTGMAEAVATDDILVVVLVRSKSRDFLRVKSTTDDKTTSNMLLNAEAMVRGNA